MLQSFFVESLFLTFLKRMSYKKYFVCKCWPCKWNQALCRFCNWSSMENSFLWHKVCFTIVNLIVTLTVTVLGNTWWLHRFSTRCKENSSCRSMPVQKSEQALCQWHLAMKLWLQSKDIYVGINNSPPWRLARTWNVATCEPSLTL